MDVNIRNCSVFFYSKRFFEFCYPLNSSNIILNCLFQTWKMSAKEFSFMKYYLCLKVLMPTAILNLDSFADALQEFAKVHKNTGKKMFANYLPADGSFIKTIILLTVMIMTMLSKWKMRLCIAPTETSFCKLLRPCKNSCCFQKVV